MRGRDLELFIVFASLIALPAIVLAQQPPAPPAAQSTPGAWPASPATDQPAPQPKKAGKSAKKKSPSQEPPDPRFEEEPGLAPPADGPPAGPMPAPPPRKRAAAPALDIKCDGPFAKNTTFANLVKTFGPANVFSAGGPNTVLFPNDPKRRIEITWGDVTTRTRPKMILVEAQSTWRVRGFRVGDPMALVEKANGKPFTLVGFGGIPGGNARDWQGGKLDKLSGGCQLGVRFAVNPQSPPEAVAKVTIGGDFTSDMPEIQAVNPTIIELIVGYPE